MDPDKFLDCLEDSAQECLVGVRELPARSPVFEPFPQDVPPLLVERLGLLGITGLYPHQATGLQVLRSGANLMICTGTASGKTLVYNTAFAADALERPRATALYLFPTKALARDQLRAVRALKLAQVRAAV